MKNKLLALILFMGFLAFNSCKDDTPLSCDLTATITASTLTPVIGSSMTFTIVAHNNGPDNASGVDVTNNLPTGYTFTSHTATAGTVSDRAWTIGNLASGKSETLTMVATVLPTGFYPYTVSILGAEPDNSTLNNIDLVTVVPIPAGSN
jgi:uncharacterized repeat protein (TIGR01451 family)